jgi:hypothetical protein
MLGWWGEPLRAEPTRTGAARPERSEMRPIRRSLVQTRDRFGRMRALSFLDRLCLGCKLVGSD